LRFAKIDAQNISATLARIGKSRFTGSKHQLMLDDRRLRANLTERLQEIAGSARW
jgi:hypothetical protein